MTLANKISILRILLIPIFVILLLLGKQNASLNLWAIGLFTFATVTDFLDGLAARMRRERTKLGMFLDPLADKLLIAATYITFVRIEKIPEWVFVVVFSRDLIIFLGWIIIFILTTKSEIHPRSLGKASTVLQMIHIFMILLNFPLLSTYALWAMVTSCAVSTVDYILYGAKRLGQFS